jgi:type IV secretion system protein VirB10
MWRHAFNLILTLTVLTLSATGIQVFAQEPPPASAAEAEVPSSSATAPAATNVPKPVVPNSQIPNSQIIVPSGTRMPLVLRNAINTRTAKKGDSVYFETAYPIAANNRIAIPMGTFVRGEILEAKRPGRIRGRGEFRVAIEQMTFPNGYTIELLATPSSVDPNSGSGVDTQKMIEGPSSSMRDTTAVLLTTAGGAYIGAVAGAASNGAPGRGALIGGGAGGLGALIAVLATRGPEAELPRGTMMDVVFDRPLILDAAYLPANAGPGIDPQPRYAVVTQDARARQRDERKRHSAPPLLLPFLFLPLLR